MKTICTLAMALVLTAALLTGCGCTNRNRPEATTPTGMTNPVPTILPTEAPTVPTASATIPTTEETTPTGNGPLEDDPTGMTDVTDNTETTTSNRARSGMSGR